jgi:hypothetical protein
MFCQSHVTIEAGVRDRQGRVNRRLSELPRRLLGVIRMIEVTKQLRIELCVMLQLSFAMVPRRASDSVAASAGQSHLEKIFRLFQLTREAFHANLAMSAANAQQIAGYC